jgi:L-alanine-DL-glutamate epimerase-like enolase superfamily enzyme
MRRRDFFALLPAGTLLAQASRGVPSLKITKVEAFVIRTPKDDTPPERLIEMPPLGATTGGPGLWNRLDQSSPSRFRGYTQAVLVKITTGQGIVGWGESHAPAAPRVHQTVITDALAPLLIGEDAREVEPLWERLYSSQRTRGYQSGFFTEAIAGIDLALWDILGKFANLPLYRLLGGKYRTRLATYTGIGGATIAALQQSARSAVEQGFPAVKMGLSKGPGTRDLDRVFAVSEAVGARAQLLLDSLGAYKLHEATRIGRELDKLKNIGWWEDALLPDDLSGYPKLADALDTPVCAGEEVSNRFQFRDLFAAKAVDIINPDICRAGGITECRRIAIMADAQHVLWSPHVSTGTAPYQAASMHLAAATPNFVIMEGGNAHKGPFGNVLLKEPLEYQPGYAVVPDRPGLGVEFDEAQLGKVRIG